MDPMKRESDVEQWLESALGKYGKAEPRVGLETRVLANLRAEQGRIASQRRWWWAGMAAALAVLVAAVWVGRSVIPGNRPDSARTSTAGQSPTKPREEARGVQPTPAVRVAHPPREAAQRARTQLAIHNLEAATTPKLEQFPSPQPLNEQEQMLMSYVANYPETAALVAQARAEALQRDREEEAAEAAKSNME
jgi:hypothetical protein